MQTLRVTLLGAIVIALVGSMVGCSLREPVAPPLVAQISSAEKESHYRELVRSETDRLQTMYGLRDAPTVERVRWIASNEYGPVMAECMTSHGFEVTARSDGGIHAAPIPKDQTEAQGLALFTCSLQYPVDPLFSRPLAHDQLAYLYDYYVYELVPCLEDRGFNVGGVPSFQVFVEGAGLWSAYENVVPPTEEEWAELNQACPQHPEGLYGPGT